MVTGQNKKRIVSLSAKVEDREVFKGTFACYVLEKVAWNIDMTCSKCVTVCPYYSTAD